MRLAFGAVQRVRTVDHAMETLAGRSPGKLQPQLRSALRVSGYEVLFSDGVPARAAVSEGVELARAVAGERIERPRECGAPADSGGGTTAGSPGCRRRCATPIRTG